MSLHSEDQMPTVEGNVKDLDVGLDIGNSNRRAARFLKESDEMPSLLHDAQYLKMFPSVICHSDKIYFGNAAKIFVQSNDREKIIRNIPTNLLKSTENSSQEHYSMLIDDLLEQTDVKGKVKTAVFPVPVHSDDKQRQVIKDIAQRTLGEDAKIDIIDETTAAAVAYARENLSPEDERDDVLFFCMGGGFLGVAVTKLRRNAVYIKEAYGETIGGDDITEAIIEHLRKKFLAQHPETKKNDIRVENLWEEAEGIKHELRRSTENQASFTIYNMVPNINFEASFSSDMYANATAKIYKEIGNILDKIGNPKAVQRIVLIGGGSRSRNIDSILQRKFPNAVLAHNIDPEEAVVVGATIIAHHIAHQTLSSDLERIPDGGFAIVCEVREQKEIDPNANLRKWTNEKWNQFKKWANSIASK